jgi:hypothetical protein
LHDSRDAIEQFYGDDILKHFPNYEAFWRQFIGNPNSEKPVPYEYVFPSNMNSAEVSFIRKHYERIQIAHYSIFCQLAGAHFQLSKLQESGVLKDPREKYFKHWEHFEAGYLHLGSVFYLLEELWNIVIRLKGSSRHKFSEEFLGSMKKDKLALRLETTRKNVKTMRDLVVHRGRAFTSFLHKGKFYIPLEVDMSMVWSQYIAVQEFIETTEKLYEDITEVEELLNDLHAFLISEYTDFIKTKNIHIDYEMRK